MSSLSWLDYSDAERRQAMELIRRFSDREARDELGLGTIRDALSEALFPGTSTIQTRAKYFIFVPWLFQHVEALKPESVEKALEQLRAAEWTLIDALEANDPLATGIIGIVAKDKTQRLASSIYWQGLETWGIRRTPGSQTLYLHLMTRAKGRRRGALRDDDGNLVDEAVALWDSALPPTPSGFPDKASLQLSTAESDYLKWQIRKCCPESVLATLIGLDRVDDVDYVWDWPALGNIAPHSRRLVSHAQQFSSVMYGASVLYNLLLSEGEDNEEKYTQAFHDWWTRVVQSPEVLTWDLTDFWSLLADLEWRPTRGSQPFVNDWFQLVHEAIRRDQSRGHLASGRAKQLIQTRELDLKGKRARMTYPDARRTWNSETGAGMIPMDFRWHRVKDLLVDLIGGVIDASH